MFDVEMLDKKGVLKKKRKIPRSGRPAARKAITGLLWIGLFVKFSSWYTVSFTLSDKFLRYNILRRYDERFLARPASCVDHIYPVEYGIYMPFYSLHG